MADIRQQRTLFRTGMLLMMGVGVISACAYGFPRSNGVITYLLLAAIVIAGMLGVHSLHQICARLLRRNWTGIWVFNLLLAAASIMLVLTVFEGVLHVLHRPEAAADDNPLTLPDAWKKRPAVVEGAVQADYWHGSLHVLNEWGMRRSTPFPPKRADVLRIMVIGDSLTYGQGVDAADTYPSLIEAELAQRYRVEVLNLGISGLQSEDLVQIVWTFAPQLRPDIVVYGMCLNDFLESQELERSRANRKAWPFPLPASFKDFMIQRTLSGEFFEQRYDELLMKFGIRADFFANILRNLHDYQIRFTRDMTMLNYFVIQQGLPPVLAMVLDQYPEVDGRGHQVAQLAEKIMVLAHLNVIATDAYYAEYDGRKLNVSRWEGHPNQEAHRIFAHYFVQALQQYAELQPYRKE